MFHFEEAGAEGHPSLCGRLWRRWKAPLKFAGDAALKAVPKGKWYCPECAAERKELRVARKRARLEAISGAPSEYEVQRLHNIAQNKQKLQMLGLEDSGSTVNSTSTGTRHE